MWEIAHCQLGVCHMLGSNVRLTGYVSTSCILRSGNEPRLMKYTSTLFCNYHWLCMSIKLNQWYIDDIPMDPTTKGDRPATFFPTTTSGVLTPVIKRLNIGESTNIVAGTVGGWATPLISLGDWNLPHLWKRVFPYVSKAPTSYRITSCIQLSLERPYPQVFPNHQADHFPAMLPQEPEAYLASRCPASE